ncbi:MAG: acyl-CoA dehydratase activase-related protein [Anaerovoracaceae bacterium]|jgi:predicted nucleotide-binding protein (sugar kinase/HSP70/actin superfamily)
MRITFPHLGDVHRFARLMFREMGIEVVAPDKNSAMTLEMGSSISPEEMCLPFKIMAGNLISAWEKGANTVVMPATMGPCRLGEYGELLRELLMEEGFDYRWILLDAKDAIGIKELLRRMGETVAEKNCNWPVVIKALINTYGLIADFETLEMEARALSGWDMERGYSGRLLEQGRRGLDEARNLKEARRRIKEIRARLLKTPIDRGKKPLRILLTGEIYSSIEPFANHKIESLLMSRGVSFERRIGIGWWIRNTIKPTFGKKPVEDCDNPHMPWHIGGYAHETLKEIKRYGQGGFDGIIQLLPVGCMPEIVAKSVLDDAARDGEVKVLTMIFDEMGGEAGYITRVEAFLDLLERDRLRNGIGKESMG